MDICARVLPLAFVPQSVYSDDFDHPIRGKAATDSGRSRPPIPIEGGHLFRGLRPGEEAVLR